MAINSIKSFGKTPTFVSNLGDDESYILIDNGINSVKSYGSTVVKNGSFAYAQLTSSTNASMFNTSNEIRTLSSTAPNLTRAQFTHYINSFLTNVNCHINSNQLSAFIENPKFGLAYLGHDGSQGRHITTDLAIDAGIYTTQKYGIYHYLTAKGMNYILTKPEFISWISNICETTVSVR